MTVEGYLVVVDDEPFEDDVIHTGRGGEERCSVAKLYHTLEEATIEKDSVLGNGDGDNEVEIYKIKFELPVHPLEIEASVTQIKGKE